MTVKITRSRAIKRESEIVDPLDYTPDPYGDPCVWTPRQIALVVASWELSARQSNQPKKWRALTYDRAIQWRSGKGDRRSLIVWFGIGPPNWTAQRMAELVEFADEGDGHVLAAERIARGRAFAIVSRGRLSPGLRRALPKPAWKRKRGAT